MQTINYNDLTEKLPKLIEQINSDHDVICLEMPNSLRAIILSEEDYNSIMETLYLLSNPINTEKL
jgi:antitoxin YefM